jgi:putative intracellular protease/amidase
MLIQFIINGLLLLGTLPTPKTPRVVSDPTHDAATPRLTTDHRGNAVLTWAEKTGENQALFFMATSADEGRTFGRKIPIPVPAAMLVHAEGMPKLAVKANGTLVAICEVSHPTTEAPRASDLLYLTSADAGRSWTKPAPVHRDTTPGKGHSFADLTRLPNGEIGIVWLDEKMSGYEGRSVKFTQTLPQGGFGLEIVVDSNACQCCRTNLFVDTNRRLHITYRDLLSAKPGDIAARDISSAMSADGGRTWSQPAVVIADDWRVNACPHTGPSVAEVAGEVYTTWFTGRDGAVGLRLARSGEAEPVAMVLSSRSKHPQMIAYNGQLLWFWDESTPKQGQTTNTATPAFVQRIALRTTPNGPTTYLTPETSNATYPMALATARGVLIAYEQRTLRGKVQIATKLIKPDDDNNPNTSVTPAQQPPKPIKTVGILLYDGYTTLDAMGPYQVLSELMGTNVFFVAPKKGLVKNMTGMAVQVDRDFANTDSLDVLVIPGGLNETDHLSRDPATLDWIRKIDRTTTYTASVCTGAWILAGTGLLRGKNATTHWYGKDRLRQMGVQVQDKRYVQDGKYWTSAGVTAGMDMSLAMINAIRGEAYTKAAMLDMEYDPQPPFRAGSEQNTDKATVDMMRQMYDRALKRVPQR